jgi:hypothetical protein
MSRECYLMKKDTIVMIKEASHRTTKLFCANEKLLLNIFIYILDINKYKHNWHNRLISLDLDYRTSCHTKGTINCEEVPWAYAVSTKNKFDKTVHVVCPSKLKKTTLSSVYFGVDSEMANETNPSPEKSVALLTSMQARLTQWRRHFCIKVEFAKRSLPDGIGHSLLFLNWYYVDDNVTCAWVGLKWERVAQNINSPC